MNFEQNFSWKQEKKDAIAKIKYRRQIFLKIGRTNEAKKCDRDLERINEK